MASQVFLDGGHAQVDPPLNISAPAATLDLKGFKWGTVDQKIQPRQREAVTQTPHHGEPHPGQQTLGDVASTEEKFAVADAFPSQLQQAAALVPSAPTPPPSVLSIFQGTWAGNGFNTIFRPRSSVKDPIDDPTFEIPPVGPNDNILELNLTTEQLTFGDSIGNVPNRGLLNQPDITLQGVPYIQKIQDVTNKNTGKGDNPTSTGIHFEPGMFLSVPASDASSKQRTIARLASIPHGTTINAQAVAPATAITDTLKFDDTHNVRNITPLDQNTGNPVHIFDDEMDASKNNQPRIPQNLTKFVQNGTITSKIIKNPNLVLGQAIKGQNITKFIFFEVSTGAPNAPPVSGGGTANISFLVGAPEFGTTAAVDGNANAVFMTAQFWIETVQYQVNVPQFTTPDPVGLKPTMANLNAPTPVFLITPPPNLPSPAQTITVPGIQIQYSQQVNLNFATITWPHVSVATLVPQNAQPFQMT